PTVDLDQIASGDGYEPREAANGPKPRPTHVRADMCIADLAMTAGAVAPPGHDDDVVALLKSRRLGDDPADLVHDAGDLMTPRDRRRDVGIFPEVSVHQLHIGAAHAARRDLNQNFIGLNVRNRTSSRTRACPYSNFAGITLLNTEQWLTRLCQACQI